MPPKPKYTREEIVSAALRLVSQKGVEALTARELGAWLGTSPRPIFTAFESMEALQQAVRAAAMTRFEQMHCEGCEEMPLFKQIGMKTVQFGCEEPKLYQLLFMQEQQTARSFDDMFVLLGATATQCVETVQSVYGLNTTQARLLFETVWIYTFGIGALCATKVCRFSKAQLGTMLSNEFEAVLQWVRSIPEQGSSETINERRTNDA